MAKGTILRVLEGTEFTPELSRTLNDLLPGYRLEYFQEKPDHRRSIERRINSLHDAFLFILEAYPLDSNFTPITAETLRNYAEECKEWCDLSKESLDDLHEELVHYSARLIDALSVFWHWPSKSRVKDAVECLNEAEQYVIMSRGRPDLATLTPFRESEFVLQLDESLLPYDDQWLSELRVIKELGFPKTPSWFNRLPEYQQVYLCSVTCEPASPRAILADLDGFIQAWSRAKMNSLNWQHDMDQVTNNILPLPAWFNELSEPLQSMVRTLSVDHARMEEHVLRMRSFIEANTPDVHFKNTLALFPKLPLWYWVLSNMQHSFLGYVLKSQENIEDAVSFLPSRLRTLPAPANFAAHSLMTINAQGAVKPLFDKRYRSSHIASRDGLDYPKAVQNRHVDSNLSKVMDRARPEQPLVLQTLISPIHALDYMPDKLKEGLGLPPDKSLYELAREAVLRSVHTTRIHQHNHPYNIAKYVYYTKAEDPDSHRLLDDASRYVGDIPELRELLESYRAALASPVGSATIWDYDGRELFLSSLEQLIILTIGGYSYGSCVSGKDRKAVELMHTDAMILYREHYGAWPRFGDPKEASERINFVSIFADLYLSRHQHEHAGQNAPGSEGIKTPDWYFPGDMQEAIQRRRRSEKCLEEDDRLATDNEVKNISKKWKNKMLKDYALQCQLTAKQLGEQQCTALYDALNAFVGEERRFQPSREAWDPRMFTDAGGSLPRGIRDIRKVMADGSAGDTNVDRMARIGEIVLARPEKDRSRSDETNSVYDRIRRIFLSGSASAVNDAVHEWNELFENSKREQYESNSASG